jgi:predicted small metal-binding protein
VSNIASSAKQVDLRIVAHAKEVHNIPGETKAELHEQVMNTTSPNNLYSQSLRR